MSTQDEFTKYLFFSDYNNTILSLLHDCPHSCLVGSKGKENLKYIIFNPSDFNRITPLFLFMGPVLLTAT